MKNTIKILLFSLICSMAFISCEDDEKASFQAIIGLENQAPYVRVLLDQTVIDVSKLDETTINFTFSNTGVTVANYDLSISKEGVAGGQPQPLANITSFPTTLSISMAELASALGITLNDIGAGEVIAFSGISTGVDGTVVTTADLGGDLIGQPEQHNAYSFSIVIFCAPVDNPAGDWTLDMIDTWGDGWDGAFVTATIDGTGSDYTVAGSEATHVVNVPSGSTLVWSYTSGSFEGEHNFTMTGPDGTVYGPWDGAVADIPFCFF